MLALVRAFIFSEKINMAAPMGNFYFQLIAFAFLHQVRLKSFHAIKVLKLWYIWIWNKIRNDRMPYKHLVSKYLHSQVNFILKKAIQLNQEILLDLIECGFRYIPSTIVSHLQKSLYFLFILIRYMTVSTPLQEVKQI